MSMKPDKISRVAVWAYLIKSVILRKRCRILQNVTSLYRDFRPLFNRSSLIFVRNFKISLDIERFLSFDIERFLSLDIERFLSLGIEHFLSLDIERFLSLDIERFYLLILNVFIS